MSEQVKPLLDIRQHPTFLDDARDVEASLIGARRFARDGGDPSEPFASEQEGREVADQIASLKIVREAAEEHRKAIARPYRLTDKAIKAEYDELLAQTNAAIDVLTSRGLATKRQIEARRREEEERRREDLRQREEAAARKAAAAAEKADADPTDSAAVEEAVAARDNWEKLGSQLEARERGEIKPQAVRGDFASLGSTVTYKWDMVDLGALPDDHKTFNKKTIDAAVKGERAMAKAQGRDFNLQLIPGVRIWPVERGVSR